MKIIPCTILLLLLAGVSVFANSDNRQNPFIKYFDDFTANKDGITILFKRSGPRYNIEPSNGINNISSYGEIIKIKRNKTLKLISRGCTLYFSSLPDEINEAFSEYELKDIVSLESNTYLFKENIDLRSIGKSLEKKTYLLIVLNDLSDQEIMAINLLLKTKESKIVYEDRKLIMIECVTSDKQRLK